MQVVLDLPTPEGWKAELTYLDSLSRTVLVEVERKFDVIGEGESAHSDTTSIDVKTVDDRGGEVEHVLKGWFINAARTVQDEYHVRLVHAF